MSPIGVYERPPDPGCNVEGCPKRHYGRGFCHTHWAYWRVHGRPVFKPRTPEERFWAKVDKNGLVPDYAPHLGPCWIWIGGRSEAGYGHIKVGGRTRLCHRIAYELIVGPIPEGHQIDHLCRVPSCVNPQHLESVTPKINQHRGFGFSGVNARKTHCIHGHELSADNLIKRADGYRGCRTCSIAWQRQRRAKKRAARNE